jgi:hypothetical protein
MNDDIALPQQIEQIIGNKVMCNRNKEIAKDCSSSYISSYHNPFLLAYISTSILFLCKVDGISIPLYAD